jgi:L-lactate utilization protein LutB
MEYNTVPTDETITTTAEHLKLNGMETYIVSTGAEAKAKALELIPTGSEVMTMTSVTLETIGLAQALNESGHYDSVRAKLNSMDRATQGREMRKLGAAPDYTVGSVHAITEQGDVIIASNTGSQLPAYLYGAGTVIFIVGAQKIAKDLDTAMKRLYDYVLPLESERAHKAYGVAGSFVSKQVTIHKEVQPNRIHIILIKEALGF